MPWKYRVKKEYAHYKMSLEWHECTDDAKQRIEKMYPKMYEFKEDTPPLATPSMNKIPLEKAEEGTELKTETKKSKSKKTKSI